MHSNDTLTIKARSFANVDCDFIALKHSNNRVKTAAVIQQRETAAPSPPLLGGLVRAANRKERRQPIAAAARCVDAAQRKERIYNFNDT